MLARLIIRKTTSIAGIFFAALAVFCLMITDASAQQRPRTIFDLLFGQRQAQPEPQKQQPRQQQQRPRQQKRTPKAASPAARTTAPVAAKPEIPAVVKNPDAKKVLVVGDFIGGGMAEGLETAFAAESNIRIVNRTNGSSGFVRDDHYDWPANISNILDEEKPAVVIVMIGSNDRQVINIEGQNHAALSAKWNEEYQRRVANFTNHIASKGLPLIWVGQPPFRPRGMSQDMLALNEIYRNHAEKIGGKFVDVWDGFVDEDGNFSQTGFDINGQTARLRANDGINTTSAGKRKLAFYAEKPLKALLGESRENIMVLPSAETADSSKPIDRIAPVSLRDIGHDNSGILLGAGVSSSKLANREKPIEYKAAPGRADDFSWPRDRLAN
ncbi:DUF459 domain-containing protein [Falsochrobactrum ovis]|uniref:SGNH hydrolase-type esterase domain-containing protein n=1 Tax=Falsochrobactrum ovis TaxID=1293442 RepID=A0A364JSM8_9HYPH|nr:DUF459 domain-containing protein [Falsochrobactrum ovis]RAK26160.1 hypothetical protein C7374_11535 [Falsochrobactrum ovis]